MYAVSPQFGFSFQMWHDKPTCSVEILFTIIDFHPVHKGKGLKVSHTAVGTTMVEFL